MNQVEILFLSKSINHCGILLYSKSDTLSFVNECSKQGINILGIDGFYIDKLTIQPSIEYSIDFSSTSFKGNVYEEAIKFVEKSKENLYFEIVCE